MTDGERAYHSLKSRPGYQRLAELLAQGYDATAAHIEAFPASRAKRKNRPDMVREALSEIPGLKEAVEWFRAKDAKKAGLTIERCHEVLAAIIDSDPAHSARWLRGEQEIEDIPERARLAITAIEQTVTATKKGATSIQRKLRRETKTAALRLALEALGGLKQGPEQAKANALVELARMLGKSPEAMKK